MVTPGLRIVSLCPSLTELVFDLGAGADLVGRTRFCVHPASGVQQVERVGGTKNPRVDRIVALAPDLVLMNEEENRSEDAAALRAAGLTIHSSLPRTPEDTAEMVRSIGRAVGQVERAEVVATDIERQALLVRQRSARDRAVRYAYMIWRDPWMTVNDDTFVAGLLRLANGTNVFGTLPVRYPEVSPANLAAADPDVVFLSSEPFPFREEHARDLRNAAGWDASRVLLVDGELLSWHGSRTPRGIEYAGQLLAGVRAAP